MAINFPSSPILDQIFTSGNTSFIWNGTAWVGYSTSLVVNYNASSIVIKDDGSSVGAAGTIDFGSNLSVSFSSGVATVTGSASGSSSQFVTTAAGIHTLSNVGIGTTNPTSALTVTGNGIFTGVVTATTFIGALTGTATSTTNIPNLTGDIISNGTSASLGSFTSTALRTALTSSTGTGDAVFATSPTFATPALGTPASGTLTNCTFPTLNQNTTGTAGGLSGTPNITVGVVTATTLNVGTGGTIITTTTAGLVGIGTTNPTSKLTVGAVGAATTNFVVNGWANISGIDIRQSSEKSLYIGEGAGQSNINVASDSRNVAIGYEVLNQNSGGDYNVVIGSGAMKYGTGSFNVIIGDEAGDGVSFSGDRNVFIGVGAGANATAADDNTAIGRSAGYSLTSGDTNVFIGDNSGDQITQGDRNTIIGSYNGNEKGLDIRTSHNNVVLSDGDGNIRFYANSSGNVGLGTTNPRFKLEVGAVGASGTSFYVNGNARVTGVLALGLASILLDGDTNTISVGAGITISGSTGIISATSFYGDTSNAVDGRWTIGNNGSSEYTFTGIGFTQTTNNPVLYLGRGRVYEFVITSGSSHPFEIRQSNGGSAYIGGVVGNGTTNGGIVRFEVPFNSPNTLYYQCTNHSGMGNTISVYPSTI